MLLDETIYLKISEYIPKQNKLEIQKQLSYKKIQPLLAAILNVATMSGYNMNEITSISAALFFNHKKK